MRYNNYEIVDVEILLDPQKGNIITIHARINGVSKIIKKKIGEPTLFFIRKTIKDFVDLDIDEREKEKQKRKDDDEDPSTA